MGNITIAHRDQLENGAEFQVIADPSLLQPIQAQFTESAEPQPSTSTSAKSSDEIQLEDDFNIVFHNGREADGDRPSTSTRKRSMSGEVPSGSASKKTRIA